MFVPALFFITLGTDNGVNFTDGLDGLCTSVTILVATFFTIVAIGENSGISPITGAVVGSLLGFLLFNVYPARVFMGDTGSLALGGFVASSAFMMQMPIFIAIVGPIYLVEVLSVIIQVTYFKKTGGKRFFKMAPIHHHFELCGWSETRVVGVFSIITAILCLIAYLWDYRRKIMSQKVLVAGTGISGIAAAKAPSQKGGEVVLYDGNEKLDPEELKRNLTKVRRSRLSSES